MWQRVVKYLRKLPHNITWIMHLVRLIVHSDAIWSYEYSFAHFICFDASCWLQSAHSYITSMCYVNLNSIEYRGCNVFHKSQNIGNSFVCGSKWISVRQFWISTWNNILDSHLSNDMQICCCSINLFTMHVRHFYQIMHFPFLLPTEMHKFPMIIAWVSRPFKFVKPNFHTCMLPSIFFGHFRWPVSSQYVVHTMGHMNIQRTQIVFCLVHCLLTTNNEIHTPKIKCVPNSVVLEYINAMGGSLSIKSTTEEKREG